MPGGGEAPTLSAESAIVSPRSLVGSGESVEKRLANRAGACTGPMRKGIRMNSSMTSSQPSPPKSINSERFRSALAGLRFPAERWQIVAWANDYGANAFTMDDLHNLPRRSYRDIRDVIDAVAEGSPRSA